ncbi:g5825 [Coccomyxa elongata]
MGLGSRGTRGVTILVTIGGLGFTALTGAAIFFLIKRCRGSKTTSDGQSPTEILDNASSTSEDAAPAEDIDDPWAASTIEGPGAAAFEALHMDNLEGLKKQLVPTVLLDKILDMSAPEIWRLVICNRDFHKTFLTTKGCTNTKLGPWSLLTDGKVLYQAAKLHLNGMAIPSVAPGVCGAARRFEYDGPSNSHSLGTKTVKYVEKYTCYRRPNAGMLVHIRTKMLKAAYEKVFEKHTIWFAKPLESGKTRLEVSCGGMKKSFLL